MLARTAPDLAVGGDAVTVDLRSSRPGIGPATTGEPVG
jgi:hypothetical protein